ncbi:formylmethanofuran dehydrogenase subunit E [Desulfonatronum thiosulfatophilum]|uniref:Formylmethanofuran dehydrogenase subunit E n=1 Tax=Desulfonatronum thiosulfatophilum TaxID=617002 RepID=A0A1G6A100_9BACT|nr:FmdE family protein [Desulfonatronum thiosulfatophilum]SDB02077.1 formylmethanofuran dehydrogenase subunit E [Desulfonatronum thiosulfatophilum]
MQNESPNVQVGKRSFDDFLLMVRDFHGSAAPGLVLGGFMVEEARRHLPEETLFDAISETTHCLPDAVQLLTPCTIGNGWLRIINLGRYALTLYDKYAGNGVRIFLDSRKVESWPAMKIWYMKLKPKKEQDSVALFEEIKAAGASVCSLENVQIAAHLLQRRGRGGIVVCPVCGEAYPQLDGRICRACQGEAPYVGNVSTIASPPLRAVPVDQAVGRKALHDMTRIEPGKSKDAVFVHGQEITVGDICRLQQMGRMHVYVQDQEGVEREDAPDWVHENQAAESFARAMAGEGVELRLPPREGKVDLLAARDGLLSVGTDLLEAFNLVPDVMCASRHDAVLVKQGMAVAGTRAVPLYISKQHYLRAMSILEQGPLFSILPLRKAQVGILVTGTEVFQGLVEDKFIPIVSSKVQALGSDVLGAKIVPDSRSDIAAAVRELLDLGVDLLVTTAGLSVDPDDVTRQALLEAGAEDLLYGTPILPGTMTLFARIGQVQVLGVPACALFFKTTSLDLFLPRLLAGRTVTRRELARMGAGSLCMQCRTCSFPKCPFGK